jgi:hypothetical protein
VSANKSELERAKKLTIVGVSVGIFISGMLEVNFHAS